MLGEDLQKTEAASCWRSWLIFVKLLTACMSRPRSTAVISLMEGLTKKESLKICRLLDSAGIDSIEISGNGTSVSGITAHKNEGYFAGAAADIASAVSCPVMAVGGFRSLDTMEAVLNQSEIELISLSRPLLREPDLPKKMMKDASAVSKCISCNACYSSRSHRCIFRRKKV